MPTITMSHFNIHILFIPLLLIASCSSPDDNDEAEAQKTGFFTSIYQEQPLDATLAFDLDSLLYYKQGKNEVDGIFTLNIKNPIRVPVELRARGVFRKKYCPFPPIRLQIKKAAVIENNWGEYRNYKLVTHCSDTAVADELLLREYLIYKMYEELSSMSFKTQLLRLKYLSNADSLEHFAFLIENENEMSDRLGLQDMDIEKTKLKSVHIDHYKRFVMFQYMVGNTDWNLKGGHNTKYVLERNTDAPIIIPYDFDCAGLVNAPYAMPYSTIPIETVRDRYFMYRGKKGDDFSQVIIEFKDKKSSFYSLINDFPYMSKKGKNDIINFLSEFYDTIEQTEWKDIVFQPRK